MPPYRPAGVAFRARRHEAARHCTVVVPVGTDPRSIAPRPPASRRSSSITIGELSIQLEAGDEEDPLDRLIAGWRLARSRSPLLSRARIELWGHVRDD